MSEQSISPNRRFMLRLFLLIGIPVLVLVGSVYAYTTGGRYVTTENAYVKSDIIEVSTNIDGLITDVRVSDNQRISAGDVLFHVDARLFEKQLAVAEADVESARQTIEALRSRYREGQAVVAAAWERVRYLKTELDRQDELLNKGHGTQAKFDAVEHDVKAAERQLTIARETNRTILAQLGGDPNLPLEQHPQYLHAIAERDLALVNLSYTEVVSPVSGVVTRVSLEKGEYVEAGESLMAIVDTVKPWVEANLKEVDLEHVSVGQKATVVLYSLPDVEWAATVESISPATGAEFSVLPPQNATGNWVKVVQRVPVRLVLADRAGMDRLRAGLTATISIDTERSRDIYALVNNVLAGTPDP